MARKSSKTAATASASQEPDSVIDIATTKVAKKGRKSRKTGTESLDVLSLGKDGKDPTALRNSLMEKIKDASSIGFCKMDVVNPNLIIKWHEFNDRPLSVKAVKELKENFVDNGQQVMSPANVFRLLVKTSWLDFVPEKTIVGKGIDELQ